MKNKTQREQADKEHLAQTMRDYPSWRTSEELSLFADLSICRTRKALKHLLGENKVEKWRSGNGCTFYTLIRGESNHGTH